MTALTRQEIADALDKVDANWDTLYVHYKLDATCLVVEIELDDGVR